MFKKRLLTDHASDVGERKPKALRTVALISCVVACAPFLFEAGVVCYAQWNLVMGREVEAPTPLCDWMSRSVGSACHELMFRFTPTLDRVAGDPQIVLPASAVLIVCAMLWLKR